MSEMTLNALIDYLEQIRDSVGEDAADEVPVRLAIQPNYPFEHQAGEPVLIEGTDGDDTVVFIPEGSQIGYLSGAARNEVF